MVAEVNAALEVYVHEVQIACDEAAKEAAEKTMRELKAASPKRKRGKSAGYSRGWKVKRKEESGLKSFIVYNNKLPGLTHLLEYGHAKVGGGGRTKANPHIKDAADSGEQFFVQEVKRRLR